MNPLAVSLIAFVCVFCGTMFGVFLRTVLPEHHLNANHSRRAIKAGIAILATISVLILGLLIASARASRDTQSDHLSKLCADFIHLDHVLARYGLETRHARKLLRSMVSHGIGHSSSAGLDWTELKADRDSLAGNIRELRPSNDLQSSLRDQAMDTVGDLEQLSQESGVSISMRSVYLLILCVVLLFVGLGLLTSTRSTALVSSLLVNAVCIAAGVFLIVALGRPLLGAIQSSGGQLNDVLRNLGP
jgi:hypothetical protein